MQKQTISYQAIDEDSGKTIIRFELERGMMKEEQMKKDEAVLIPTVINMIQGAVN
jgi:hypothetical protein